MDCTPIVAANIRAGMARNSKRVKDLAEITGKSYNAALLKYRGETQITVQEIATISEWLGIQPGDLFKA